MFPYEKQTAEAPEEGKPAKRDKKSLGRRILKGFKAFFVNQLATEEAIKFRAFH